jgi:type IV secretion system protein VirB10
VTGSDRGATVNPQSSRPSSPKDAERPFHLRPDGPFVTRLSRKVLVGGSAFALLTVAGAVILALNNNRPHDQSPDELYSTDHRKQADGLSALPRDYAGVPRDVPRLGVPLPFGLGEPFVSAQSQMGLVIDAERQRLKQETEAARTSKVFTSTNVSAGAKEPAAAETPNSAAASDEGFAQNGQDRKLAFVSASVDRRTTTSDRLTRPASPFIVQAGTVIPAALITGLRSDLPGQVTAQVTENVYDSPTGRARLIPQGARLIGTYDSQVAFGQSRVLLVWTRLIMPNGRSIVLERQVGADPQGSSGLEDDVDNHWGELFKAALLSTTLGVGAELGSGADNGNNMAIVQALRAGAANSLNQTGQQVVRRNLNIQPTLTIRPGFPVRVIVNRDLVLEPDRG